MNEAGRPASPARRHLGWALLPLAVVGLLGFFGWATAQYVPRASVAAVMDYLAVSPAQGIAPCVRATSYAPYQTNGNRLRRWLRGQPADPDDISVDFSDCSVRFYLRRQPSGAWRVYRVQPHAG